MTVKMQTAIAGHADPKHGLANDFSFGPGEVVDLPDELAAKWIDAGHATDASAKAAPKKTR